MFFQSADQVETDIVERQFVVFVSDDVLNREFEEALYKLAFDRRSVGLSPTVGVFNVSERLENFADRKVAEHENQTMYLFGSRSAVCESVIRLGEIERREASRKPFDLFAIFAFALIPNAVFFDVSHDNADFNSRKELIDYEFVFAGRDVFSEERFDFRRAEYIVQLRGEIARVFAFFRNADFAEQIAERELAQGRKTALDDFGSDVRTSGYNVENSAETNVGKKIESVRFTLFRDVFSRFVLFEYRRQESADSDVGQRGQYAGLIFNFVGRKKLSETVSANLGAAIRVEKRRTRNKRQDRPHGYIREESLKVDRSAKQREQRDRLEVVYERLVLFAARVYERFVSAGGFIDEIDEIKPVFLFEVANVVTVRRGERAFQKRG